MSGAALGGCGCTGAGLLVILCVPLLFFGVGGSASASAIDGPGAAAHGGAPQVIPAGGSSCDAAVGCQPIPGQLGYVPVGFYPDHFTDPPGECTSWAAALWPGDRGRGVTWGGDAWEWYSNAAAQGFAVSSTPSLGAIVVFERTSADAGAWGHVAAVIGVDANSIRITEMNYSGRFVVDERSISFPNTGIAGFIPVAQDAFT